MLGSSIFLDREINRLLLISIPLVDLVFGTLYTHRYLQSVADVLSGGRMAGRWSSATTTLGNH